MPSDLIRGWGLLSVKEKYKKSRVLSARWLN
jgi:hypothetical protein